MALTSITIITPDNLKSILSNVFNTYTSRLINKINVKTSELSNVVSVTTNTTSLAIGISGYVQNTDILHIYQNNVLLDSSNYTINVDNTITFSTPILGTTDTPISIKFVVTQSRLQLNT